MSAQLAERVVQTPLMVALVALVVLLEMMAFLVLLDLMVGAGVLVVVEAMLSPSLILLSLGG